MNINKIDLERRLQSRKNVLNVLYPKNGTSDKTVVVQKEPAKRAPNVPIPVKITAGALAVQTSVREASDALGIGQSVVQEAMHSRNDEVREGVNTALDRVKDLALDKLIESLDLMSPEKMDEGTAKDLSTVAANMSRIVEKVSPRAEAANVQLIIYAPQQKEEKQYQVVDV